MFAIVRTGGKQYRVAAGDKIVVEKLAGEAGDSVELGDVLLAGDGGELKSTSGLIVAAEIVAQAKADKVTVFKKKRRHNYRRKRGHRQQLTILKILSIGGEKPKKAAAKKADAAPAPSDGPAKIEGAESPATDSPAPKKAAKETVAAEPKAQAPKKAAATKAKADDKADAAPAKKASTKKPASAKDA
jgi:large subunit ribosomal protein L21